MSPNKSGSNQPLSMWSRIIRKENKVYLLNRSLLNILPSKSILWISFTEQCHADSLHCFMLAPNNLPAQWILRKLRFFWDLIFIPSNSSVASSALKFVSLCYKSYWNLIIVFSSKKCTLNFRAMIAPNCVNSVYAGKNTPFKHQCR